MKALLLAAGKGERLKPITDNIPKVMIEIGKKPCLQHSIELLVQNGINEIAINTHYIPEAITNHFQDGKKFGARIRYSYEKEILGTSGSINNFRDFFDEDFLVVYGDVIHAIDLKNFTAMHEEKKGFATLALDSRNQLGKGVVILDANKKIKRFVEKPEKEIAGGFVNSGLYLFNKKVLEYIPSKGCSDFGKDIFPKILEEGKEMYGFIGGKAIDIGTYLDLAYARRLFN